MMGFFSKALSPLSAQVWKRSGVTISLSLSHAAPAHNGRTEALLERTDITRPGHPPGAGGSSIEGRDVALVALVNESMCKLQGNQCFRELLESHPSEESQRALPDVIQWITGCFIGSSKRSKFCSNFVGSYEDVKDRAQQFVISLMKAVFEDIKDSPNMRVLRKIHTLERDAETVDVIARDITEKFWQSCIDKVSTPGISCRVTAFGTPGVGMTFVTFILVRMLLDKGHNVVHLIKSSNGTAWYYEFLCNSNGTYTANVYPESTRERDIASLRLKSTFYIVDPGRTSSADCSPTDKVQARVILISSPDWSHRDGCGFPGDPPWVTGEFLCYPPWSLAELVAARQVIHPMYEASDVVERYRIFGGFPGIIFGRHDAFVLQNQALALSKMSSNQLERILEGKVSPLECLNPENPMSALMTYDLRRDVNGQRPQAFDDFVVVPISGTIAESLHHEYLQSLSHPTAPKDIFRKFAVALLTRSQEWSAEISALKAFVDEDELVMGPIELPYCTSAEEVPDPIMAVADPNSLALNLYFSLKSSDELIDCIYKDEVDHVHAIHIAFEEAPSESVIRQAKNKLLPLASYPVVTLYVFVPNTLFGEFYLSSQNPDADSGVTGDVVVVSVSKPKRHSMSILQNPKLRNELVDDPR
jgi:hypothetical protein